MTEPKSTPTKIADLRTEAAHSVRRLALALMAQDEEAPEYGVNSEAGRDWANQTMADEMETILAEAQIDENANHAHTELLSRIERVSDPDLCAALRVVATRILMVDCPSEQQGETSWSVFEDADTSEGITIGIYQF